MNNNREANGSVRKAKTIRQQSMEEWKRVFWAWETSPFRAGATGASAPRSYIEKR